MSMTDDEILAEGCRVFNLERQALEKVENDLGAPFVAAVRLILQTKGNVIFSGVGKSGHIGRKLAATFSSTGTTSFFVHSDEAAHGDLGMIRPGDVFVGISFSGESSELMTCVPALKAMGIPIIAMTANAFAEDRQRAFAAGMDMHIAKPLEGSEMVETLERFVKSSRK